MASTLQPIYLPLQFEQVLDIVRQLGTDERQNLLLYLMAHSTGATDQVQEGDAVYGFPGGVERTLGVCGGSACIVRTRIPVWSLVSYKKLGVTDEALLENFPTLRKPDLLNAWAYYALNRTEIEEEIKANDEV
jgi:uncharacterized protein (DUF433 family)